MIRRRFFVCVLAILLMPPIAQAANTPPPAISNPSKSPVPQAEPSPTADHLSLAEYQARLQSLEGLVTACQQTPANCSSEKAGHDLTVDLPSGPRSVSFGWLRTVLDKAGQASQTAQAAAHPKTPTSPAEKTPASPNPSAAITLPQQLEFAQQRLQADQIQISQINQISQSAQPRAEFTTQARTTLTTILAQKQYHSATAGRSIKDRVLEKIANWIDSVVGALVRAGSKSRWIGLTAEIAFVALLAIALVWFLIRLERQGRFGPSSINSGAATGAASERDWRLWAEDARQAAAHGAWREAIHFLYWSSISRLESSGLWPADRARTPREYLALLAQESTQRPTLLALTRDFERSWYAGQSSTESDYRQAEQQAASLSTNPASARSTRQGSSR